MHNFKNKNNKKQLSQTSVSNMIFVGTIKSSLDKFELIPDSLDERGIFSLIIHKDDLKQKQKNFFFVICLKINVPF